MKKFVVLLVVLASLRRSECSSCDDYTDLCMTTYTNGERRAVPSRFLVDGTVPRGNDTQTCCESDVIVMPTCEMFQENECESELGPAYCKVADAWRTPCVDGSCSANDCCIDCVSAFSSSYVESLSEYTPNHRNQRCSNFSIALGHFDDVEMCRETAKIESRCYGTFSFSSTRGGECRCCSNESSATEEDNDWDIYTYDHMDFSSCVESLNSTTVSSSSLETCFDMLLDDVEKIFKLDLSNLNLTFVPVLQVNASVSIQTLDLSSNIFESLPMVSVSDAASFAQHLDLSECNISNIGSNSFENLPNLKVLSLSRQHITSMYIHSEAFGSNLDALEMIDLSGNMLETLPNGILSSMSRSLRVLWLGENNFQDFYSSLLGLNHSFVTDLNLTSNLMDTLSYENFAYMHSLRSIDLSNNRIVSLESDTFSDAQNLTQLWLNSNMLMNLPSDLFSRTPNLSELYLYNNNLQVVKSQMFSIPSLKVLNLFYNSIREIESDAFASLSVQTLDLSYQSVERIHENAFRGVNISEIRLGGNNVRYVSASSFVQQQELRDQERVCHHVEDWTVELVEGYFFTCDEFEALQSHIQGFHLGTKGSAGLTPADACCELGGGVRTGSALQMDERSTVSCFSNDNFTSVQCSCGDSDRRFDLNRETCVNSCVVGERWEAASSSQIVSSGFLTSAGKCVQCEMGLVGNSSVLDWPESCVSCEGGTFTSDFGSTECRVCESNTYSDSGASECISCPSGKISSVRSHRCETCSWEYTGSRRCETMVLGLILIVVSVVTLLSTIVLMWSKLRAQFKRLIAYRVEMLSAKKLLETAHDDINLMCSAWHFDFSEVSLDRKLAAGAAGQVWLGSLHEKWKVAIKEMFFSDEISLVDESEIKFLRRVRHRRLVLFLGCGRTDEGYIFTVLELMNGGSFDRLLWEGIPEHCNWKKRLQILADSAEGMSFLHAVIGSVHRDLKSPNILLDQERGVTRAKIADFGLARLVDQKALAKAARLARRATSSSMRFASHSSGNMLSAESDDDDDDDDDDMMSDTKQRNENNLVLDPENVIELNGGGSDDQDEDSKHEVRYASMTGNRGTSAWMAPEMWSHEEDADEDTEHEYSQSVDVYAFAIIMWEAICFAAPWGSLKVKKIREKVMNGDRPHVHKKYISGAPKGYVDLMKQCWAQKEKRRPTFPRIFNELQAMRIELEQIENEASEQGENREEEKSKKTTPTIRHNSDDDAIDESSSTSPKSNRKRLPSSTPSGLRFWHARSQRDR